MAGPFGFFRLGARLAQPFIRAAVWAGRSVLQTARDILAGGVEVLDRELAAVYRKEEALKAASERTEALGEISRDAPIEVAEAVTRQRRRFAYNVRGRAVDPATGRVGVRFVTISSDDEMTREQIINAAENLLTGEYLIDKGLIVSTEVTGATEASGDRLL